MAKCQQNTCSDKNDVIRIKVCASGQRKRSKMCSLTFNETHKPFRLILEFFCPVSNENLFFWKSASFNWRGESICFGMLYISVVQLKARELSQYLSLCVYVIVGVRTSITTFNKILSDVSLDQRFPIRGARTPGGCEKGLLDVRTSLPNCS